MTNCYVSRRIDVKNAQSQGDPAGRRTRGEHRLRIGRKQSSARRVHEPGGVGRDIHGVGAGGRGVG